MKKNKFFLALSTVALSAAMVGVASAGTFDSTRQTAPAKSVQHQVYMNQQDSDAMTKAMDSNRHKLQNSDGRKAGQDTAKEKGKHSDAGVKGSQASKTGPQLMGDKTSEQMAETHKQNQEKMNEIYQDMSRNNKMVGQHESMSNATDDMHQAGAKMKSEKGGMMRS